MGENKLHNFYPSTGYNKMADKWLFNQFDQFPLSCDTDERKCAFPQNHIELRGEQSMDQQNRQHRQ